MSREALVVGVNLYPFLKDTPTSKAKDLRTPVRDAEAIAQLLEKHGEFQQVRRLLVSNRQEILKSEELEEAITQLFKPDGYNRPETALLFFSGHGLRKSQNGSTEGFLATSDANPRRARWGFSLQRLSQLLQESSVPQQIVWLDCCFSGELLNFEDTGLSKHQQGRDRCFIAASREFESAYEESSGSHGVLTRALLQSLDPNRHLAGKWVNSLTLGHLVNRELEINPALRTIPQCPLFNISGGQINLIRGGSRSYAPKLQEVIALSLITLASLISPLQQGLLDKRVYIQAIYRDILHSIAGQPQAASPPVVLLQIDEDSIRQAMKEAGTQTRSPIPQGYLTKLITELARKKPKVVGIDYLLDSSQGKQGEITQKLGDAIAAATNHGTRFVFAMYLPGILSLPEITGTNIANANSSRTYGDDYHIPILWQEKEPLPFAYWLTWLHRTCIQLKNQENQAFCKAPNQQLNIVQNEASKDVVKILPRLNRLGITAVGHWLNQQWLHPITDFSIPPNEVYEEITAKEFLENPNNKLTHLSQQTVLIAAKYDGAGTDNNSDNFNPPSAIAYNRTTKSVNFWDQMSGGEHHAYLFYLFLNQRLVVPVPDLWAVGVAALAGKGVVLLLQWRLSEVQARTTTRKRVKKLYQSLWFWALPGGTVLYSLLSLQLYLSSAAILLPIVLPTAVFWAYVLPPLTKREI